MKYSPVYHVMVESEAPGLADVQGPDVADARATETYSQLQRQVQQYYEEEQRQMTARISAYVEQEEKQLEKLRAQALRDRDALWNRVRVHMMQQQRRTTASSRGGEVGTFAGSALATSSSSSMPLSPPSAPSPTGSLSPAPLSSIDGMQTTPALPSGPESPVHPLAVSASSASASASALPQPTTPLGPETEEDRHRVFNFDEEIPFYQPSPTQPAVTADSLAAAAALLPPVSPKARPYDPDLDQEEATPLANLAPIAADHAPPAAAGAVAVDASPIGRPRRVAKAPAPDESYAGFAMHDGPVRPRLYSASLPVSVPPAPSRLRAATAVLVGAAGVVLVPGTGANPAVAAGVAGIGGGGVGGAGPAAEAATTLQGSVIAGHRPGWPSPNTETALDQEPPSDMARSFAVPVSSSRKIRAVYF